MASTTRSFSASTDECSIGAVDLTRAHCDMDPPLPHGRMTYQTIHKEKSAENSTLVVDGLRSTPCSLGAAATRKVTTACDNRRALMTSSAASWAASYAYCRDFLFSCHSPVQNNNAKTILTLVFLVEMNAVMIAKIKRVIANMFAVKNDCLSFIYI